MQPRRLLRWRKPRCDALPRRHAQQRHRAQRDGAVHAVPGGRRVSDGLDGARRLWHRQLCGQRGRRCVPAVRGGHVSGVAGCDRMRDVPNLCMVRRRQLGANTVWERQLQQPARAEERRRVPPLCQRLLVLGGQSDPVRPWHIQRCTRGHRPERLHVLPAQLVHRRREQDEPRRLHLRCRLLCGHCQRHTDVRDVSRRRQLQHGGPQPARPASARRTMACAQGNDRLAAVPGHTRRLELRRLLGRSLRACQLQRLQGRADGPILRPVRRHRGGVLRPRRDGVPAVQLGGQRDAPLRRRRRPPVCLPPLRLQGSAPAAPAARPAAQPRPDAARERGPAGPAAPQERQEAADDQVQDARVLLPDRHEHRRDVRPQVPAQRAGHAGRLRLHQLRARRPRAAAGMREPRHLRGEADLPDDRAVRHHDPVWTRHLAPTLAREAPERDGGEAQERRA